MSRFVCTNTWTLNVNRFICTERKGGDTLERYSTSLIAFLTFPSSCQLSFLPLTLSLIPPHLKLEHFPSPFLSFFPSFFLLERRTFLFFVLCTQRLWGWRIWNGTKTLVKQLCKRVKKEGRKPFRELRGVYSSFINSTSRRNLL